MPRRILVADDEKAVREMLRDVLNSEGYEVETVPDGLQALENVKTHTYDLILLDVGMPGADGYGTVLSVTGAITGSVTSRSQRASRQRPAGSSTRTITAGFAPPPRARPANPA